MMLVASSCSPVAQPSCSQQLSNADVFGPDADGRTFFCSAQLLGGTIRLDDFVLVDLDGAPRTVMQVSAMWRQANMPLQGEFRRLFRPDETFEGRKPYHGDLELLISNELLVLPLNSISSLTRVETFTTFCHRQHFSQGVHYFTSSEYYDPQAGRVLSKSSQLHFVSTLRQRMQSLLRVRRPAIAPADEAQSSAPLISATMPDYATTPAAVTPSPQPQAAAQEHRDSSPPSIAAPVVSAPPDSPNAPGQEAEDSPGAREAMEATGPTISAKSLFVGDLVHMAELVKMREEDAEVEKRANEVISRLKRRAAAVEEMLGSPERLPGELTSVVRTTPGKKSPRSPTKKSAKAKTTRAALQFTVVK